MHSGAETQGISDGAASLLNRGRQTQYSDRNVQQGLEPVVAMAWYMVGYGVKVWT